MKPNIRLFIFILMAIISTIAIAKPNDILEKGKFLGKPILQFISEKGRIAKLLEDFSYLDPYGETWTAKTTLNGKEVYYDGASIPQIFWTYIGSPWSGEQAYGSIIHDYYCFEENHNLKSSASVHKMFYNSLITAGMSKPKALIYYSAVLIGGPDWKIESKGLFGPHKTNFTGPINSKEQEEIFLKELKEIEGKIKNNSLDIDQVYELSIKAKEKLK